MTASFGAGDCTASDGNSPGTCRSHGYSGVDGPSRASAKMPATTRVDHLGKHSANASFRCDKRPLRVLLVFRRGRKKLGFLPSQTRGTHAAVGSGFEGPVPARKRKNLLHARLSKTGGDHSRFSRGGTYVL